MFHAQTHTKSEDFPVKGIESSSPFFTVAGEVLTSVVDFAVVNAGALILCNASSISQIIQDQTCNTMNLVKLQDYEEVCISTLSIHSHTMRS